MLLLLGTITFSSCSRGGYKKGKQLKKGKPIPCPTKDC